MILKTFCEVLSQEVFPSIRALVAQILIEKYGYTQTKVSKILGVTQPAISYYLSGKRGGKRLEMFRKDEKLMELVNRLAKCIVENDDECGARAMVDIINYVKDNEELMVKILGPKYRDKIRLWKKVKIIYET